MHRNSCLAWLAAQRAMLCPTNKFVVSVSAQITSKCCEDGIPQPIKMGNLQHTITLYHLSLLMWCFKLMHCSMYFTRWATEKSQEAGTALHILGALHWSYNAQKLYIYSSQKVWCTVFWRDLSMGSSLSACHFRMVISNDWKRKLSRQAVTHKSRNWTECCNCRPVYTLQVFEVLQPAKMCNLRPKSVICGEHPSSNIQCIQSH